MSRFTEELRVVPRVARIIAAIVYVTAAAGFKALIVYGGDPEMRNAPIFAKLLLVLMVPAVLAALVLMIGYVNGDAKRRRMKATMWTLLAIFVPNALGVILYFILRDPLPAGCPACGVQVPASFTFCPHCGAPLQPTCPQCGKGVEHAWANCAFCGVKLPHGSPRTAPAV
jgi:Double zinc ribbon/Phospholipase_D-nuclease N-terminal